MATDAEIAEEARRARALRLLVDAAAAELRQADLDRRGAEALVAATRRRALALFPGREGSFDLILAPRFARIIAERFGPSGELPFQPGIDRGVTPGAARESEEPTHGAGLNQPLLRPPADSAAGECPCSSGRLSTEGLGGSSRES